MLADAAGAGAIACCLVKSCPAGNLPFADLTQATTFIDFAPCTIIILPCIATSKTAREARAVAELRGILQQEASLLDKRGLSVWRIRQDSLTVIGKMSILGFRLAEFGVNAVDGVHTWNLVCQDDSMGVAAPPPPPMNRHQQTSMMAEQHQQATTPARNKSSAVYNRQDRKPELAGDPFADMRAVGNTFDLPPDFRNVDTGAQPGPVFTKHEEFSSPQNPDNFLSSSYAESSPRRNNIAGMSSTKNNSAAAIAGGGASRFSLSSLGGGGRSTRTAQAAAGMVDSQQSGRSSENASTSSLTDSAGMSSYDNSNNLLLTRRGAPTMLAPASFAKPKVNVTQQQQQQMMMTGGTVQPAMSNNFAAGVGHSAIRRLSAGSGGPSMAAGAASSGGGSKKSSKKRKKKSLGMGRSKSRKRIPSNFGPLHPRTAALLETRRTNLVPEELKAEQHDGLIPLLERVQVFLNANPQLGLRPRWRLLQPIGHPHCTAHFKCTTHVKGAQVMCPARIAVGLDRITRRYHITYEMISHECQQQPPMGNNSAAAATGNIVAGTDQSGVEGEEDDDLMSENIHHEEGDLQSTGVPAAADDEYDDDDAEDADDNDDGRMLNAEVGGGDAQQNSMIYASDENDLSGNMSIKIDEDVHNDDRSESPWATATTTAMPSVSFAANDEARE